MTNRDEIRRLASAVSSGLNEYIEVHNKICHESATFKSVIKKPFGRGTSMSQLLDDSERLVPVWAGIHEQLDAFWRISYLSLTPDERAYFEVLLRYAMAVKDTVHALVQRQRLLNEGSRLTWELLQEKERLYKSAVAQYVLIGRELNAAAPIIFQGRAYEQTLDDFKRRVNENKVKGKPEHEGSGNATQTRKYQLRRVSPFENMPDVGFVSVVAVVSGIGAFMLHGILRWTAVAAFSLALLYIGFRLSFRLFPQYMRLHGPLAVRYVGLVGFNVGVAERTGRPFIADEDFVCRFLSDSVYQNLNGDSAQDLLRETQFKATNFVDRDALLQEFVRRYPTLDCARFGVELDQLVRSQAEAPPIPGYIAEWLFADVIERSYGKVERVRYLADVVTGRVGIFTRLGQKEAGSDEA